MGHITFHRSFFSKDGWLNLNLQGSSLKLLPRHTGAPVRYPQLYPAPRFSIRRETTTLKGGVVIQYGTYVNIRLGHSLGTGTAVHLVDTNKCWGDDSCLKRGALGGIGWHLRLKMQRERSSLLYGEFLREELCPTG